MPCGGEAGCLRTPGARPRARPAAWAARAEQPRCPCMPRWRSLRDQIDRILASDRALRCAPPDVGLAKRRPALHLWPACRADACMPRPPLMCFPAAALPPCSLVVAMETALEDGRFDEAARLRDEFKALKKAQQLSSEISEI